MLKLQDLVVLAPVLEGLDYDMSVFLELYIYIRGSLRANTIVTSALIMHLYLVGHGSQHVRFI